MTFTTRIKDEITKETNNSLENRIELLSYLKYTGIIEENKISLLIENASVARYIFKLLKINYNININLTIRTQKRFKLKKIFILSFTEKADIIKEEINNLTNNIINSSFEEMASFLKGVFLSCGSINDPSKSKYHLEYLIEDKDAAELINNLLLNLRFKSKVIRRDKGYMVYIKVSEEISDFIKLMGATNSLFYYEDIRIYRDHKNMVNRLNNCEQANIEKSMKTCKEQLENIKYLKDNDLLDLLDDKIKIVINYREKYPETTMSELANIISLETENPITKSGINHYFRKIKDLVNKNKKL
ncbi:MAG: DNA-binding protein WhiA [Bacilli bacterium]|nr:DNA-binding protein WhiA [Bacilli bacterium]